MPEIKSLPVGSIDWLERTALVASFACMAHCLALPLIVAALPVLSTVLAIPESFHIWVLAFAAPAALIALVQGRSRHGAAYPLWIGLCGLGLLTAGALVLKEGAAETIATVAGSLCLAFAHIANWRLRRSRPCGHAR